MNSKHCTARIGATYWACDRKGEDVTERRVLTDAICERCWFVIQRLRWFDQTWDSRTGRPAGGRAIEAGLRCSLTRELVARTDTCDRFRYARQSSGEVEVF
jgi:hypothetical protein